MIMSATRTRRGIAAGAAAALLGALVFGFFQGKAGDRGPELGYWALCIGLLVGAALGKPGNQDPLPADPFGETR
ncbi:hypothetical protein LRS74_13130 [Streptomyces sp. LX-29]|uniref:hypothetical protein n=1 Tax=Streptomyces sp. LX-29 TaxID=2900152 RepID=UPI00240D90C5|nr:hypothetical protein [Streptomyces sp. LX-29]WFB07886.1 hypothetical protein LRS74_13130 [Streptomyces sp. LX-29]